MYPARTFAIQAMLSLLFLLTAFLVPSATTTTSVVAAPRAAPDDTPITVVSEPLNEWTIGNGLLYWADRCFGGEFRGDGYLRRKPLNGGTQRTLATVDANNCVTFLNAVADETGLYYYSSDRYSESAPTGIHHRPAGAPFDPPQVVTPIGSGQFPMPGTRLALGPDHIYWLTTDFTTPPKLLRIRRDGSGAVETVANVSSGGTDLLVNGSSVFWLDDSGLWSTNVTSCSTVPCAKTKLLTTTGSHLIYRRDGLLAGYQLYWVERSSPQRIRRRNCVLILQPGGGVSESCSLSTLYTAPTDHPWRIGLPSTDGSNLFWKEAYLEIGGSSDGRLRRRAIGGSVLGPVEDIAVNLGIDAGPTELYNGEVYFGFEGIKKLPWNATPIVRDLTAVALEVTQGIQSLNNDVALVAQKRTYVRAYGGQNSGPHANAVAARLVGTRGSTPLPGSPLNSINGTRQLFSGVTFDRAKRNDGWLFQLPTSWTNAGSISLQLVVDPQGSYSDPNTGNNQLSRTVSFQQKAPICTVFVPVRTHAPKATTDLASFWPMVNLAKQMLPTADIKAYKQNSDIAELQVCWAGPFPYPCFGPYELPSDDWKIMASLWTRDLFSDDPDSCDDAGAVTHYVGLIHPSTSTGGLNGMGNRPGSNLMIHMPALSDVPLNWRTWSAGEPRSDRAASFPHELGHNYNRKHIACGSPADPDNNYPYTNPDRCRLDDGALNAASTHYAWDTSRLEPTAPNMATDLMSYGRPRWPSDYTWTAIMNRINNSFVTAAEQGTAAAAAGANAALQAFAGAENVVLVTGAYTPTNVVENGGVINYAYLFPKAAASQGQLQKWQQALLTAFGDQELESAAAADTVLFQLLDPDGTVLAEQPAIILELADDDNVQLAVAATIPEPAGDVATVRLVVNGVVVAKRTPGPATPTLTLAQPTAGITVDETLTVAWTADDANEGDRLLYVVQYSPDGGANWRTISSDIAGPGSTAGENVLPVTVQFNASDLPGSNGANGLVRVLASDGYHTAIATSPPFTVLPRKPEPFIITPHAGATVAVDQPLLLTGGASDAEDGTVASANLAWQLNGVAVGSGEQLIVTGLAPGETTIQLSATDSDGQSATVERTVTMLPLTIPAGTSPTLDGYCDESAYAGGSELPLAPYGDGTHATVHLLRSGNYLYACFQNMALGATNPGAFAGVRVDKDNSRDALAQSDDYGFFVGEDGGQFTYAGDGAGNMNAAGPGGLVAQISAGPNSWAAELRIDVAGVLDGWEHPVSLNLGHYWVGSQGDDYEWPYVTTWNAPKTWATTALGTTPTITALEPDAITAGSGAATLVISGTNFRDGASVQWHESVLATSFGSSTLISATLPADQTSVPFIAALTVRNPGGLESVPVQLPVVAPTPTVASLVPATVKAGTGTTNVQVSGSGFLSGATVLWDGQPVPTTYGNGGVLTAAIDAAQLAFGGVAGVAVENPGVDRPVSNSQPFTIEPDEAGSTRQVKIYLPVVLKE